MKRVTNDLLNNINKQIRAPCNQDLFPVEARLREDRDDRALPKHSLHHV